MLNETPIYDQIKAEQATVTMTLLKDDPAVHALIYGADTTAARLGIKRTIEAEAARAGRVYMAPAGTPLPTVRELQQATYGRRADKSAHWQSIGWVANDGIDLDNIPADDWHRANPPIRSSFTVRLAGKKSHRRAIAKLFTGRHRLPGDKPLIHKGKKP